MVESGEVDDEVDERKDGERRESLLRRPEDEGGVFGSGGGGS